MPQHVKLERRGWASLITIDRPESRNALNQEVLLELKAAVAAAASDDSAAVVITGGGEKAFVAGADIGAMARMEPPAARAFAALGQGAFAAIEACPKPVIAAINGHALGGGCELALACDIRLAADTARLGQPEVKLGVIPGFGGTQRLPRLIGRGRAKELIFTGRVVTAQEALAIGLVDRVVPAAELLAAALSLADEIAQNGPRAVSAAKGAIDRGLAMSLAEGQALEAEAFAGLFGAEQREGMEAFLAKRPAKFR